MGVDSRGVGGKAAQDKGNTFDFAAFYRDLEQQKVLQLSREEVNWQQRYTKPTESVDVVLNFGCGVQVVPHLMTVQTAVFEALGVDFVATAGPAYCCGLAFSKKDRQEHGDRLANKAIEHFASWRAPTTVQCCGSCYIQFDDQTAKLREETGSAPFEVVHYTRFLLERLRELGDRVPWAAPERRRVLLHAEGAEMHPTKEVQREDVIATLKLVPGVEFVGLVEDPSLGRPCTYRPDQLSVLHDVSPQEYRQVQAELLAQMRAAAADAILTHHHRCHYEWSKFASDEIPVMHYEALLLEALGRPIPDRFQGLWRLGNVDKILEATRPYWGSWGISEDVARDLVRKFFVPAYAAEVHRCPCTGTCVALEDPSDRGEQACPLPSALSKAT